MRKIKFLLCVNNGKLISKDGSTAVGEGLKEGEIYTTFNSTSKSEFGDECYFINETDDLKQCVRFKEISKDKIRNALMLYI